MKRLFYDPIVFGAGYDAENYTYEKYVDSSVFSIEYFHYLFYRFSEVFIVGLVIFIFIAIIYLTRKHIDIKRLLISNRIYLYIIFYILSWSFILQYGDKKFGRYFLIVAIPLTIFSSLGYKFFVDKVRSMYLFHTVVGLILMLGGGKL